MTAYPTGLCSELSASADEPLDGTAIHAPTWLALEQPGPWGRKALTQSHLDTQLGDHLEVAAKVHQIRLVLIRRPEWHPDLREQRPRQVLVAHTRPDASWLASATIEEPESLLSLDWQALTAGAFPAGFTRVFAPVLLVCTNGQRDLCCALAGRQLANALTDHAPGQVWESSHLSGHRFAPTCVVLPSGVMYGRSSEEHALGALRAETSGHLVLEGARGRSAWPPAGQAAELAVRRRIGETRLDAVTVNAISPADRHLQNTRLVMVSHADGRHWRVEVREETSDVTRPDSCYKLSTPFTAYRATVLDPVDANPHGG